jgi:hypothetical protein
VYGGLGLQKTNLLLSQTLAEALDQGRSDEEKLKVLVENY